MVRLSIENSRFLLQEVALDDTTRAVLLGKLDLGFVLISDELADKIRDSCLELYDQCGLGCDYQPTNSGRELERLIDKLLV